MGYVLTKEIILRRLIGRLLDYQFDQLPWDRHGRVKRWDIHSLVLDVLNQGQWSNELMKQTTKVLAERGVKPTMCQGRMFFKRPCSPIAKPQAPLAS